MNIKDVEKKEVLKKEFIFIPNTREGSIAKVNVEISPSDVGRFVNNKFVVLYTSWHLSFTANCNGSSGQASDSIRDNMIHLNKKDRAKCTILLELWNKYHLKTFKNGTNAQMDLIEGLIDMEKAREVLKSHDMLIHKGHEFGSQWILEENENELIFVKDVIKLI